MQDSTAQVTPQRIMGMVWGFAAPLALEAAVKHRVFDTLDERPKTLDEIARDTGASRRGLRAISTRWSRWNCSANRGRNIC